jgi:tetratricopeptide (TPR) repeat protein
MFPYPDGYRLYKEARSVLWGTTVRTARFPSLRSQYAALPRRVQDALDWYLKGLQAHADADRFIAFWIAVEIMRNESAVRVEEPTILRCGHKVANCPDCQKSTTVYRQAESTKKFLADLGIPEDVRKRLWKMRQIVHGAHSLNEGLLKELGDLVQFIQVAAIHCLKAGLGTPEGLPAPVGIAPAATRGITLLMRRELTDRDLHGMPKHLELQVTSESQTGLALYATLSRLGLMLRDAGDLAGAEAVFRKLIEASEPDVVDVGDINLGVIRVHRGDSDGAIAAFQAVIDRNGRHAVSAANNLAVHYIDRGLVSESAAVLAPFARKDEIELATRRAEVAAEDAIENDPKLARSAYEVALLTANSQRRQNITEQLQRLRT